ncbi:MAG TPA: SCO family protein, partial [Gemmatimonadales bacterium]|nr:SCO family protein [Gemmatimonadales bacterium]
RRDTRGAVTLLFFGYTHCPDVCPVHMANLAAVLDRLPTQIADRVRVVFVTTDPERDTPARLREWLGAFDARFIGLTGPPEQLERAQIAAGVLPAVRDTAAGENYSVGHAAQVIAYTADGLGRVMYPFGTRQADWEHDLPRLVRASGEAPAPVAVEGAFGFAPPTPDAMAVYFTLRNRSAAADTLVAAEAAGAGTATIHRQVAEGGRVRMAQVERLPLPGGGRVVLEPGGLHLMLDSLASRPVAGDTVRVRLRFARAPSVDIDVPIRRFGE